MTAGKITVVANGTVRARRMSRRNEMTAEWDTTTLPTNGYNERLLTLAEGWRFRAQEQGRDASTASTAHGHSDSRESGPRLGERTNVQFPNQEVHTEIQKRWQRECGRVPSWSLSTTPTWMILY
jgi:hypothetical protein